MRIFVTGGTGFLGKHLLPKFPQGYEIFSPNRKQINLLNFEKTYDYINWIRPNIIIHMAASCGGILANKNSPADFLYENTQMGLNIYKAANECNIKTIYSLGSVCSYPKYCPTPFKEENIWDGAPEETNFPYGQSKRTLLMLSQTYREQYKISGAHLIPVNLFGEYDNFNLTTSHVIPALIKKFLNAKNNNLPNVECWGTGDATREFLYAGDAAEAIVKAVVSKLDSALPINLGTGKDISIKKLAELIKTLINYNGNIIFNGNVSDGQPKRLLDVSRAETILNWKASTTFKDGLIKTINWYSNQGKL